MKKGFTLLELVVLITVLTLLLGFSFPLYNQFSRALTLNTTAQRIVSDIHLAQQAAVASQFDHAVHFEKARYIIQRDNAIKNIVETLKVEDLPRGLNFRFDKIIKFATSGYPKVGGTGTIILEDSRGKTKKIIISSVGRVRVE